MSVHRHVAWNLTHPSPPDVLWSPSRSRCSVRGSVQHAVLGRGGAPVDREQPGRARGGRRFLPRRGLHDAIEPGPPHRLARRPAARGRPSSVERRASSVDLPSPATLPTATDESWRAAPAQESVRRVQVRDVVWTGERFVATASVIEAGGGFLASSDGRIWTLQSGTGPPIRCRAPW